METFAPARPFVDNPGFQRDRERMLAALPWEAIDPPIRGLIAGLAQMPCCYTLQCCYGHFVHAGQPDPHNLAPLPADDCGPVEYRIAYLALCLDNSPAGRRFRARLAQLPAIDVEYVQFGSPDWFWVSERHLNSFALQVEPDRFKHQDVALVEHQEALHLQQVRDRFFERLAELVQAAQRDLGAA